MDYETIDCKSKGDSLVFYMTIFLLNDIFYQQPDPSLDHFEIVLLYNL